MRYFRANAGRISEIVSRRWDRNAEGMRHEGSRSELEAHVISRLSMVFCSVVYPFTSGPQALQCLGCAQCSKKDVLVLTNETYVNSQTVCQMLWKIARNVGHGVFTVSHGEKSPRL